MNIIYIIIFFLVFSILIETTESFNNCDTKKEILKMVDSNFDFNILVEPQSELFNIDDKNYVQSQINSGKKGNEIAANLPGC